MTQASPAPAKQVDVAAYFFPGYHVDPATSRWHGSGWTEWDLVEAARPRYEGHRQPRVSAWGAFDESDPEWAARQAEAARSAGIDAFIFDWYWYENAPFLNGALDRGFLPFEEFPTRFAIMWANHDWLNIHPASAAHDPVTLFRGGVSDYEFDAMADVLAEKYFGHPRYYRRYDGAYFSIYEPQTLIEGIGGRDRAARALDRLRERVARAGAGDIHLNVITADRVVLPGERSTNDLDAVVRDFGASSVTSYVWIHHYDPSLHGFPAGSYAKAQEVNEFVWESTRSGLSVPYFPNVTVGWDSSPRVIPTDSFDDRGYPWTAVLDGTPAQFGAALERALEFAAAEPVAPRGLVTLNAWNEWTEGSYLLPDAHHGEGFLDACRAATLGRSLVHPDGMVH